MDNIIFFLSFGSAAPPLPASRYFDGKSRAEQAIAKSFPSAGVLIKPSFIYGGDSFGLTPPRVSDGYGSGIDSLLSSGPIRAIAGISPGLIKVWRQVARRRTAAGEDTFWLAPWTRLQLTVPENWSFCQCGVESVGVESCF